MFPQNADPDAMRVNKLDLNDLMVNGVPLTTATELFENWFKQLQLPERKKIMPLAHNLPFDKAWFIEWLGEHTYNHYFDYHGRDTVCAALFLNDRANFACEKPPFPKVNLQYLASQLAIVNEHKHDALHDALTCARIYKKMLGRFIPAIGETV
jgi:DNA polymerase III alpha subunit (gram-positive type)